MSSGKARRRGFVRPGITQAVIEALEYRLLLTALPNPSVPPSPLPQGNVPLVGLVGSPLSLSPEMMRTLYGMDSLYFDVNHNVVPADGSGQTIAIVDAFGSSTIINDVQVFDRQWGLSNDDGQGNFFLTVQPLAANVDSEVDTQAVKDGWSAETSLDVEWAHVMAPGAHIELVEAPSQSLLDLVRANTFAAALPGVSVVSNSWGFPNSSLNEPFRYDGFFSTPVGHEGVTFFASSGDTSNPLEYPSAASFAVIGVGGFTEGVNLDGSLHVFGAWPSSGGGSNGNLQTPYNVPLVSMDADPLTGVWVYDSQQGLNQDVGAYQPGEPGWFFEIGGTSLACPMFAAYWSTVQQGLTLEGAATLDTATAFADITIAGEGSYDYFTTFYPNPAPAIPLWGNGATPTIPDYTKIPNNGHTGFGSPNTFALTDLILTEQSGVAIDNMGNTAFTWLESKYTGPSARPIPYNGATGGIPGSNGVTIEAGSEIFAFDGTNFSTAGAEHEVLAFGTEPSTAVAGQPVPSFTVDVEFPFSGGIDSTFNGLVTVAFPDGTATGTLTVNAVNGVATFSNVVIQTGTSTAFLKASASDFIGAQSYLFAVTSAAASQLVFIGPPIAAYQYAKQPGLLVSVEDTFGNIVTADNSRISLSISSGPGHLIGTATARASGGVAAFSNVTFDVPGVYTLEATDTDDGLPAIFSSSFTISAVPVQRSSTFNGTPISEETILLQQHRNAGVLAGGGIPLGPSEGSNVVPASSVVAPVANANAVAAIATPSASVSSSLSGSTNANLRNDDAIDQLLAGN